ncbi:hypothetical protein BaRGS_00036030 [Batillaria attramentaria]|uniref:Uncharacterized protein n=1 Tax=Batillaria attramentaria TaxID=370345 RepID=A0ABD0JDQ9_9CAEN
MRDHGLQSTLGTAGSTPPTTVPSLTGGKDSWRKGGKRSSAAYGVYPPPPTFLPLCHSLRSLCSTKTVPNKLAPYSLTQARRRSQDGRGNAMSQEDFVFWVKAGETVYTFWTPAGIQTQDPYQSAIPLPSQRQIG